MIFITTSYIIIILFLKKNCEIKSVYFDRGANVLNYFAPPQTSVKFIELSFSIKNFQYHKHPNITNT